MLLPKPTLGKEGGGGVWVGEVEGSEDGGGEGGEVKLGR